jgi:hypothetical protein
MPTTWQESSKLFSDENTLLMWPFITLSPALEEEVASPHIFKLYFPLFFCSRVMTNFFKFGPLLKIKIGPSGVSALPVATILVLIFFPLLFKTTEGVVEGFQILPWAPN